MNKYAFINLFGVCAAFIAILTIQPSIADTKQTTTKPTATGTTLAVIADLPGNHVINHGTRAIIQEFSLGSDRMRITLDNLGAAPILLAVDGLPAGEYDLYRNNSAADHFSAEQLAQGIPVSTSADVETLVSTLFRFEGNLNAASQALPPAEHGTAMRVQQLHRVISELQFRAKSLSVVEVRIQPAGTPANPASFTAESPDRIMQELASISTDYAKLVSMAGASPVAEVKTKVLTALNRP